MYAEKFLKEFKLTSKQKKDLDYFYSEFKRYNKNVNLSSNINVEDFFIKNVKDSLGLLKFLDFDQNKKIIDVGSGGGFPGVVFAIINRSLNITLIDSNRKKTFWLKYIVKFLELENVNVIWGRIETQREWFSEYDYVIFRAFSKTSIIVEMGAFLLKKNGLLILYKGKNYPSELKKYDKEIILNKFDVQLEKIEKWELEKDIDRYFLFFKKLGLKTSELPRRHNKIMLKPYF